MEATNAKLEVILDRMNTMTDEMQNFCKQMEDYGSDLNDIKRKLVDKDHPAPGP
jgi:archaellum component FlaC